jgi:hypothetical protein
MADEGMLRSSEYSIGYGYAEDWDAFKSVQVQGCHRKPYTRLVIDQTPFTCSHVMANLYSTRAP